MKRTLLVLLVLGWGGITRVAAAQSPGTLASRLVGTWRLVSSLQRMDDGSQRSDPQVGPRAVGYLMYDATGHMCVVIANPDRPAWATLASPTDAEVRSAFENLVAYCGRYETDERERAIIHHVEVDREPHVAQTDRRRVVVALDRRTLVYRPDPLPPGVREWTIVWERVSADAAR